MPRERKQRGHKPAEKRRLEKEEEERKYLEAQERDVLFYDRPKNPFGLLTHEDERFFSEVHEEFKKNELDDEDAKDAFIQNVFTEMKGKELKIATSPVSKFFESLLPLCPRSELQRIMMVFKGHTRELAIHRFGSFALEKIAGHAGIWISKDLDGTVEDQQNEEWESLEKLFQSMVEELIYPEMHELFRDPFAHHVYQAFLNTLSGHPGQNLQSSARKRKRPLESTSAVSTPSSFVHLQQNFLSVLKGFQWPVLETLVFDKYSAPLIQSVIELDVPVKPKKKSKGKAAESMLVDILLTGGGDPSAQEAFINRLLQDAIGSRILEIIIRIAPDATVQQLFTDYFKTRLIELGSDDISNFCVQRILERLSNPEDVSVAITDLLNRTQEFIINSKISIVTAMLDTSARTNIRCTDARRAVYEAIRMLQYSTDDLWTSLMELDRYITPDKIFKRRKHYDANAKTTTDYPVSQFGALLAASLIRLPGDTEYRVIEDLTKLETSAVLFYMTHPYTSHVIESMLSTQFPIPWRRKIVNHILGSVVALATDAAGSHIIDACWEATNNIRHQRDRMARELAEQADVVRNDFFGKRVWRNWNMNGYITNQATWRHQHESQQMHFAKMPVVKKKPWQREHQQEPDADHKYPKADKSKKKAYAGQKGIVTKHFSAIAG